jgi:hypothetical protein
MASFNNGLASFNTPQSVRPPITPGANAPTGTPTSNALFGDPGALTSGLAGKTGVTQSPQISLGAKGKSSLPTTNSAVSQLGGAK